jgi:hypothetical protein
MITAMVVEVQAVVFLHPTLTAFPKFGNVTKLKKKVTEMWTFAKKESTKPKSDVPKELLLMGLRQAKEYEDTCAKEKAAMDKQKFVNEKVQKDMEVFEASTGALPPGVKGMEGGGRQQHSTNLHTLQPASYAYANASTNLDNDDDDDDDNVIDLSSNVVTPKTASKKKGKPKNNQIERLAKGRGAAGSKKSKLDILNEKLKGLQDSISFCKNFPGLNDEYEDQMEEYKETLKILKDEQKKALMEDDE